MLRGTRNINSPIRNSNYIRLYTFVILKTYYDGKTLELRNTIKKRAANDKIVNDRFNLTFCSYCEATSGKYYRILSSNSVRGYYEIGNW